MASLSVHDALPSASSVYGMPASRGDGDQPLGDALVLGGAARDRRARAERARARHARLVAVRVVVGVRHVERDRDVGLDRVRGGARARVGGLLAHGGDRDDLGAAGRRPRRRGARPRAPRARRGGCRARARRAGGRAARPARRAITIGSPICTALAASASSLAPMSTQRSCTCGTRLRSSSLRRCRAALPMTPGDRPGGRAHRDALADQHGRVPAADLADEEHAGGVDVLDHEADLVDVADERDPRGAARVDGRERAAQRVVAHLCELPRRCPPDLGGRSLVARGPDCAQQTVQQDARTRVDALLRHAPNDSGTRGGPVRRARTRQRVRSPMACNGSRSRASAASRPSASRPTRRGRRCSRGAPASPRSRSSTRATCRSRVAGEVKGFDPVAVAGAKEARRMDRNVLLALAAAKQAADDAGARRSTTRRAPACSSARRSAASTR